MTNTERAKHFIRENYSKIKGVENVADALNVPYETLRKNFRRRTSTTLIHFLRLVRVNAMKRQLEETDKYCYQICYDVGYTREETGEKAFRTVTDMSMNEYRLKNEGWGN